MLPLVSLVVAVVPPTLVWRVLHRRPRTAPRLVLAALLGLSSLFAGWRALGSVTEGPWVVGVLGLALVGAVVAWVRVR